MEVLEDVEEAVEEEGVVLHQLVVLRQLRRRQHPQLRVDRRHLLHLPRHPPKTTRFNQATKQETLHDGQCPLWMQEPSLIYPFFF